MVENCCKIDFSPLPSFPLTVSPEATTLKSVIREKFFAEHPPFERHGIAQNGSLLYCQSLILMPK